MKLTIGDVLKHKEERMKDRGKIPVVRVKDRQPKYWTGLLGDRDDFGRPYGDLMYDGKTKMGPWANMSHDSWMLVGIGKLGTGYGQKYKKQADGRWLKVEG